MSDHSRCMFRIVLEHGFKDKRGERNWSGKLLISVFMLVQDTILRYAVIDNQIISYSQCLRMQQSSHDLSFDFSRGYAS